MVGSWPATHKPLVHSHPPQRVKGENQRAKVKKTSWVEVKTVSKSRERKKGGKSDAKAITYNLPLQTCIQPSNSYFPSTHTIYCWAWCYIIWNISLVSLGQPSRLCPPPSLLPTPETEKALTLCICCPATAKTSMCYQHCFGHQSKTQQLWAAMKKINSIPTSPSTGGWLTFH